MHLLFSSPYKIWLDIDDFFHLVMLNSFQHPLFQLINLEIPKYNDLLPHF